MTTEYTATRELSPPPAGVIRGESIPRENQQDELVEARVQRVMNALKIRGEPYRSMCDRELREAARGVIRRSGGDG